MKNLKYITLLLILFNCVITSCQKMDSTYKEFIENGETIYVSKPDSLKSYAGNGRIQLEWLLVSDPKVKSYKIYWNNKADSLSGTVTKTDLVDTIRVIIPSLAEGLYNFEIIQYDSFGNSSVKSNVTGRAYGNLYASTLYNRLYKSIKRTGDGVNIEWGPLDETMQWMEVEYLDANNTFKKLVFNPTESISNLPNFPFGGSFKYRTVYAPEKRHIDKFNSVEDVFEEVITEIEADKAAFKHHILPTDTYQPLYDSWGVKNLWDGVSNHVDYIFYVSENAPNLAIPNWFTIDLGAQRSLTKVRVNQLSHSDAWLFSSGAPKRYEIYATNEPPADGSFDNWDLLGSFTSVRPSGQNYNTDQDIEAGRIGETQVFTGNTTAYQYIRFKVNETWGGVKNVMLSELTFYEVGSAFKRVTN